MLRRPPWVMADTINAGDENHTGRDARRENLRVMTCAAMHYMR